MVGGKSKKVIGFKAMSKNCSDCKVLKRKHGDSIPIPDHECVKNHDGSSKSMECEAILLMAIEALDKGFSIETIVADDDTTMKKTLRYDYKMLVEIGEMKKRRLADRQRQLKKTYMWSSTTSYSSSEVSCRLQSSREVGWQGNLRACRSLQKEKLRHERHGQKNQLLLVGHVESNSSPRCKKILEQDRRTVVSATRTFVR